MNKVERLILLRLKLKNHNIVNLLINISFLALVRDSLRFYNNVRLSNSESAEVTSKCLKRFCNVSKYNRTGHLNSIN